MGAFAEDPAACLEAGCDLLLLVEPVVASDSSLRGAIEALALQLLINHIDDEKLATLATIIKNMETSARDGDAASVVLNDLKFHRTVCEMTGHRKLLLFWGNHHFARALP